MGTLYKVSFGWVTLKVLTGLLIQAISRRPNIKLGVLEGCMQSRSEVLEWVETACYEYGDNNKIVTAYKLAFLINNKMVGKLQMT